MSPLISFWFDTPLEKHFIHIGQKLWKYNYVNLDVFKCTYFTPRRAAMFSSVIFWDWKQTFMISITDINKAFTSKNILGRKKKERKKGHYYNIFKCIMSCAEYFSAFSCVFARTHLVVLAQISPHAGSVSSSHEHMVRKEVYSRYGAGKFARGWVVMIPEIRDHVVKLQQLVALVLLFEPCVKGDFGHGAVGGRADGTGCHVWSRLPG